MKIVSVFNNVLGPVMRGPSSSHTAGSYHIGRTARDILGGELQSAAISFDSGGSYGAVYREQGSDRGFVAGLRGWEMTDPRFHDALDIAKADGIDVSFAVSAHPEASHPNWVMLNLASDTARAVVTAASVGGGSFAVTSVNRWGTEIEGDAYVVLMECAEARASAAGEALRSWGAVRSESNGAGAFFEAKSPKAPPGELMAVLQALEPTWLRVVEPVFYPVRGRPIFSSAAEILQYAAQSEYKTMALGHAMIDYESALLGIVEEGIVDEMLRRYDIMKSAASRALAGKLASPMQLLSPSADAIFDAEEKGILPFGSFHTRAAARAMAVMHANCAMEVVCAAPTGGAAGALPGAIMTLEEEFALDRDDVALSLFAAAAVGFVLDTRATFAAEVAGCQVEIGAGGAMASAAAVQAAGGTAAQAFDAAAISFQNTMGSVCDLVQGIVEIPCHTRNAVAAASAFVNADLILGGYVNPVPLDETIDAVFSVGRMLPHELRCTSLGGLATCPSALALPKRKL